MRTIAGWLVVLLLLGACYRSPMMNRCGYGDICLGDDIKQVEKCYGCPYRVFKCPDGSYAHVYIERLYQGGPIDAQRHYILKVRDGKVVDRRVDYHEEPLDIVHFDDYGYWE